MRVSLPSTTKAAFRYFSSYFSSTAAQNSESYRFVVAGGGAGGLAIASSLARKHGDGSVAVIEPSQVCLVLIEEHYLLLIASCQQLKWTPYCPQVHYYQPMWTLVGGGEKTVQDSTKPTSKLIPKNARWIQAKVEQFDPQGNAVYTSDNVKVFVSHSSITVCGENLLQVNYDYLIVAMGLQVNFNKVRRS